MDEYSDLKMMSYDQLCRIRARLDDWKFGFEDLNNEKIEDEKFRPIFFHIKSHDKLKAIDKLISSIDDELIRRTTKDT